MSTVGDVEGAVAALVPGTWPVAFGLKHIGLIVGALGCAVLGIMLLIAKADARHWHKTADQQTAVLAQTVANYRAAQDEATRLDKANVSRVQTQQAAITEKVSHDYESQLAASTDRYERLRAKAEGYLSRPGPEGLPDTRETTCQTIAGAGCAAIPPLLKAAQDNTDQLIALQAWVKGQGAVDFGNGLDPTPSH